MSSPTDNTHKSKKFVSFENLVLGITMGAAVGAVTALVGLLYDSWAGDTPLLIGLIAGASAGGMINIIIKIARSHIESQETILTTSLAKRVEFEIDIEALNRNYDDVTAKLEQAESYMLLGEVSAAHNILIEVLGAEKEISQQLADQELHRSE
jgi:ABC-type Fe3+-siderophore transport system permease subunit